MTKYYKIWLKPVNQKKIMSLYALEEGGVSVAQLLFDRLPFGVSLVKYQELSENQFERASKIRKSKGEEFTSLRYRNIEEVLDEGFCNRVQE